MFSLSSLFPNSLSKITNDFCFTKSKGKLFLPSVFTILLYLTLLTTPSPYCFLNFHDICLSGLPSVSSHTFPFPFVGYSLNSPFRHL